jgi:hypothetical protein
MLHNRLAIVWEVIQEVRSRKNVDTTLVPFPSAEELHKFQNVQTTNAYFCEIQHMATLLMVSGEL